MVPCNNFVGLYIGGVDVDDNAEVIMKDFFELNNTQELVGFITLNGSRFSVSDLKNDHGNFNAMKAII